MRNDHTRKYKPGLDFPKYFNIHMFLLKNEIGNLETFIAPFAENLFYWN